MAYFDADHRHEVARLVGPAGSESLRRNGVNALVVSRQHL